MSKTKLIAETYFHIGNGGATIGVRDEGYGPTIFLETCHFGNNVTKWSLHITKQGLQALKTAIDTAVEAEYSKEYVVAARVEGEKRDDLCSDGPPCAGPSR